KGLRHQGGSGPRHVQTQGFEIDPGAAQTDQADRRARQTLGAVSRAPLSLTKLAVKQRGRGVERLAEPSHAELLETGLRSKGWGHGSEIGKRTGDSPPCWGNRPCA